MKRLLLLAVAFAGSFGIFAQDIPATTFGSVTISADVVQSNLGDGYVVSVSDTNSAIPYIRLNLKLQSGASVPQFVANLKSVNRVFIPTSSPVAFIEFQEMAGVMPVFFVNAPK